MSALKITKTIYFGLRCSRVDAQPIHQTVNKIRSLINWLLDLLVLVARTQETNRQTLTIFISGNVTKAQQIHHVTSVLQLKAEIKELLNQINAMLN
jgi:hypothetical protein